MEIKKISDIKPCRCGYKKIDVVEEKEGALYGCGIGCLNICCDQGFVIAFGLTQDMARKRAVKKWNRGVTQ